MARSYSFNTAAIVELLKTRQVGDSTMDVGEQIARDARAAAPVGNPSKGGARSIEVVRGSDSKGAYTDVSWDAQHFYMRFQEHRRPFLLPAALKNRTGRG